MIKTEAKSADAEHFFQVGGRFSCRLNNTMLSIFLIPCECVEAVFVSQLDLVFFSGQETGCAFHLMRRINHISKDFRYTGLYYLDGRPPFD